MGLKNFRIVFDNPWTTYYCGQPVTGRLLLTVDSPKKIRGIVIHFKGEAATKWNDTQKTTNNEGNTVNETVDFTGQETYFENKYNLVGGASGEVTLQAGEHCYPFNTVLPPNLPSSFEGEFGHVRYTVKVTIDRPWKFDQETKAAFTVISPLDLNLHETAKDPVKLTEEKFFCCCCCRSGPLTVVASLPASGYVSGQQIPVTVEVDNISQEEISHVTVTLRKHVSFTATSPSKSVKKDKITIGEINLGSVGKNGSATWKEVFPIPPLPPSNLANCSLIDLKYDLKIVGKVSGMFHRNVNLAIPLVFGTVPLANFLPPAGFGDGKVPVRPVSGEKGSGDSMPNAPTDMQGPAGGGGEGGGGQAQPLYPTQPMYPTQPPNGTGMPDSSSPGMQPNMGGMQPNIGGMQPNMGGMQPNMGGMQPNTGGMQPNMGGMQPNIGGMQPNMGGMQPNMGGMQPNMGGMQPPQGTVYPGMAPQGMPSNPPAGGYGTQNPLYPTLPPPSYAESTSGPKNIQDAGDSKYVQGDLDFTPRYPMYNYPNPYAPAQ